MELLREFVELAPKEWCCEILSTSLGSTWVAIDTSGLPASKYIPTRAGLHIDDDRASAEALIFLLDFLEGEERDPQIGYDRGHRPCACYGCGFDGNDGHEITNGKTRIEAVLRAVVQVLKAKVKK